MLACWRWFGCVDRVSNKAIIDQGECAARGSGYRGASARPPPGAGAPLPPLGVE